MNRLFNRSISFILFGGALALFLVGCAANVRAQGDLEKTPWATTMVYPVGDPLDYERPASGDHNGFSLSRGVNLGRRGDRHEGLDLANRTQGAEVRAVAPGLVVCTRSDRKSGWGNMVVLAHRLPGGDVLFSLFAHLLPGSIRVEEGQLVALGQPLGKVGRTGHATGPHLHLEFRSLTGSLEALRGPLTHAWESAHVVDPLRIFAAMRTRNDSFGLPPGLSGAVGIATPSALTAPPDPLLLTVQDGGLPQSALDRPDEALTRGELYRLAYSTMRPAGAGVPARWTTLRGQILRRAKTLPSDARSTFDAARLPGRESDAQVAASLTETRAVMAACDLVRASSDRLERPVAGAPNRSDLELGFPQGIAAVESDITPYDAAPLPRSYVGPPAVSRRQAAMLWAYVAAGGTANAGLSTAEPR
ncbi:MAG: M23 family metallopeptidase [Candidatus Eisenbacteria bacterium]